VIIYNGGAAVGIDTDRISNPLVCSLENRMISNRKEEINLEVIDSGTVRRSTKF